MAHVSASTTIDHHARVRRSAWLMLVSAFLIFCALLSSTLFVARLYYVNAMLPLRGELLPDEISSPVGISLLRSGQRTALAVRAPSSFSSGDQIDVAREAGYSKIGSMRFDDGSRIDLWANTSVSLLLMQRSRWSGQVQQIVVQQQRGYARYDLASNQLARETVFEVQVQNGTRIRLQPGSYSIGVVRSPRQVVIGEQREPGQLVELAVRSGEAVIVGQACGPTLATPSEQRCVVQPGQLTVIDEGGVPSLPSPARWELIRDGAFAQYTAAEYNRTTLPPAATIGLRRSDTWIVSGVGAALNYGSGGFFDVLLECNPAVNPDRCEPNQRISAAQFARGSGQNVPFVTSVKQRLGPDGEGVDISEYRSLRLSAYVRVLNQSLAKAGDRGTECPLMIRVVFKQYSPTDDDQERVFCFYAKDAPGGDQGIEAPGIEYIPVELYRWHRFDIDLRDPQYLPEARLIKYVELYANGHDYQSEITRVSLLGTQ